MTSASSDKNGLVIADSGAIFSLAVLDQLELFDDTAIPSAVWEEITTYAAERKEKNVMEALTGGVRSEIVCR